MRRKINWKPSKTKYKILVVWKDYEFHSCAEFDLADADKALACWKQHIADGDNQTYVLVQKWKRKSCWSEVVAQFAYCMEDCNPIHQLPKYVYKKVQHLYSCIWEQERIHPKNLPTNLPTE